MRSRDQKQLARKRSTEALTRHFGMPSCSSSRCRGSFNILALTGSFYMLQVYDRALPSGSLPTLVGLSTLAIGLYVFQGVFDVLRQQILVRIGAQLDRRIAPWRSVSPSTCRGFGFSTPRRWSAARDVDTVRGFLGSPGLVALFDLPWTPVFLVFVYMLHPYLGGLTIAGAVLLTFITIVTELLTRRWTGATQQVRGGPQRHRRLETPRNADVLKAMGFAERAVRPVPPRQQRAPGTPDADDGHHRDLRGHLRVLRMILQSAVLGLGAYLVIGGELSAGSIHRGLHHLGPRPGPHRPDVGNWKGIAVARRAFGRLSETLVALSGVDRPMPLPMPQTSLRVGSVTVAAPGSGRVLLSDVNFELQAGQIPRRHRPERGRQDDPEPRAHGHLADPARRHPARRSRPVAMGRGQPRPHHRVTCRRRSA